MLQVLETSAFADWVNTAWLGFPFIIALHSIGMAAIVGVSMVVSLHALRPIAGLESRQLGPAIGLAKAGLVLNATTGLMLFASRGSEYIVNPAFLIKLVLVLLGSVLSLALFQSCARQVPVRLGAPEAAIDYPRPLAALNMVAWFGAVASGRMIAYASLIF